MTEADRIPPYAKTAPYSESPPYEAIHEALETRHILERPLHNITVELGEAGLIERFQAEVESTDWPEDTKCEALAALAIAIEVHKGQERGPYSYPTHILRVATRILSKDHFNIKDQPNLIIAALLHDSVEDRPGQLIAILNGHEPPEFHDEDKKTRHEHQEMALSEINRIFTDPEVEQFVGAVTNPPSHQEPLKTKRNENYREHVKILLLEQPLAGIIKLSDFIDNCAGLKHNECPKRASKLASKYYDLIPIFIGFVGRSNYLSKATKQELKDQLERARGRCIERNPSLASAPETTPGIA